MSSTTEIEWFLELALLLSLIFLSIHMEDKEDK